MEIKKLHQYNKAWSQLYKLIQRGKKTYALPLYRLISTSFESKALAHHLKGDIEITFGQHKQACENYQKAVDGYEKEKKWLQALALCDQLITIGVSEDHIRRWSLLCLTIDDYEILGYYLKRFCATTAQQISHDRVIEIIDGLPDVNAEAQDRLKVQLLLEYSTFQ